MPTLIHPLRQQWQRLPQREQQALLALGLFLGLVLAWLLLWQPQKQALEAAERRYQDELQLRQDLRSLPAAGAATQGERVDASALPGFLARTSANANLTIERMDNDGPGRMNLSLEGRLDSLVAWLERLEASGVNVTALGLEVSPEADAKARLALEAG
ncbi:type II secretion system protein GspM [Pseudomonas sp. Q1-7]|uniref:type II secretion system protein GspM n=1 Tax=Pseudomonas sp. Q1-7 TaxID=3020843 RepID=UPI0023010635|nr:type II secretion system protein GspM [Pseudomonas sp. Q1-7]